MMALKKRLNELQARKAELEGRSKSSRPNQGLRPISAGAMVSAGG
jgi:hypothetical protein